MKFDPRQCRFWAGTRNSIDFSMVVYAGFDPKDWMWIGAAREGVLHKIMLSAEQASKCLVADGVYRPSDNEWEEIHEDFRRGRHNTYLLREYEHYVGSLVLLPEYKSGYRCAEVLIPLSVEASICRLKSFYYKIYARMDRNLRARSSK